MSNFRPDKTPAASVLNDFKNIPGKACLNGVDNNDAFCECWKLAYEKNITYEIIMQENQTLHVFRTFLLRTMLRDEVKK